MEYPDFNIDFVKRTITIIEELSDKTDYEVTLLINCLFGLIVIPTEVDYDEYGACYKDYEDYCELMIYEYSSKKPKKTSKRQLVKCMKNALSHLHILTVPKDGKISAVIFKDKLKDDIDYHSKIRFTVENLKEFALVMAKKYLEIISNNE